MPKISENGIKKLITDIAEKFHHECPLSWRISRLRRVET